MTISSRGTAVIIVLAIVITGCSRKSTDTFDLPETAKNRTIDNIISIEFSKKAYHFSLAEVSKGITIDYTIRVKQDIYNVIPRPQDDGFVSGPGPGGLFPFEKISGNGQSYSLRDLGLGPQNEKPARTIKKALRYCQQRRGNSCTLSFLFAGKQLKRVSFRCVIRYYIAGLIRSVTCHCICSPTRLSLIKSHKQHSNSD